MSSLRRLAGGSAFRIADVAGQAAAALWITPQMIETLGPTRNGLWVTVITAVSYIDIFDLGLTSAVNRYVSRALGRNAPDEAREIVRSAFSILLAIGLGCLVLVGLLATVASWLRPQSLPTDVPLSAIILIFGGTVALSFPLRVFSGVLEAHVRYELTAIASILRCLLVTAALTVALRSGTNLVPVATIIAVGGLFQRGLNWQFARRVFPAMRLLPLGVTPGARHTLLDYGTKNFLMKLVEIVRFRIDNLVVASFVTVAAVTVYASGMTLIRYFREIIDCLGAVLMPMFSRAEGAGDHERIRINLVRSTRVCAVAAMLIGGGIILYGELFITRWLTRARGFDFHEAYLVAFILAPPFILAMAQNPGIYLLYALSKQERLLRLNVVEAVLNLALSLALAIRFGILGVAAGTAISLLITKVAFQPLILCSETGLPRRTYYFKALLLPLFATAVPMTLCHLALRPWLRAEYPHIFLAASAQVVCVGVVVWCILFSKTERDSFAGILFRKPA